jgi:glyoxylase-like metal-dependent hydrolase (beta-lactamase superfamily II)
MLLRTLVPGLLAATLATLAAAADEPQDFSKVEIRSSQLADNLFVLEGSGGNIAALTGAEGVLLVDDEFGALAEKIRAALRADGATQPVRFIINTHYHFDHTDGNLAFARGGATLIAHESLRTRLASGGTAGNGGKISLAVKPAEAGALPVITYQGELTVHLDGEAVRVHHYANAHTDGDSVVFFPGARAVHMGDIFVRYGFPFIDVSGGGNVRGMIGACQDVIASVPADTRIIPGHGAVASVADLREYTKMLTDTATLIERAIANGESLAAIKKANPLSPWSERYSPAKGFVDTEAFTESLYYSLAGRLPRHGPAPRPHPRS